MQIPWAGEPALCFLQLPRFPWCWCLSPVRSTTLREVGAKHISHASWQSQAQRDPVTNPRELEGQQRTQLGSVSSALTTEPSSHSVSWAAGQK